MTKTPEHYRKIKTVVAFSGGIQSYIAAKRVCRKFGSSRVILMFCDTLTEDVDCYRFVAEASAALGSKLVTLTEGRDVWQIFHDKRLLGDWQRDPCSRILKREIARKWMQENTDPNETTITLGFGWEEQHRHEPARRNWNPWPVTYPLLWDPWLTKCDMLNICESDGIPPQRMYELGFTHSNCGGFCVKAGLHHYAHLLKVWPERFWHHAQQEEQLRQYLGKDVTFLSRQQSNNRERLTMKEFAKQLKAGQIDLDEEAWGGCGCME